jgi:hypothetical protein
VPIEHVPIEHVPIEHVPIEHVPIEHVPTVRAHGFRVGCARLVVLALADTPKYYLYVSKTKIDITCSKTKIDMLSGQQRKGLLSWVRSIRIGGGSFSVGVGRCWYR